MYKDENESKRSLARYSESLDILKKNVMDVDPFVHSQVLSEVSKHHLEKGDLEHSEHLAERAL